MNTLDITDPYRNFGITAGAAHSGVNPAAVTEFTKSDIDLMVILGESIVRDNLPVASLSLQWSWYDIVYELWRIDAVFV